MKIYRYIQILGMNTTDLFKYNPLPDQTVTINGKLYKCFVFEQKAKKSGNSCPCYECEIGQENFDICKSINCITETDFLYLKTI